MPLPLPLSSSPAYQHISLTDTTEAVLEQARRQHEEGGGGSTPPTTPYRKHVSPPSEGGEATGQQQQHALQHRTKRRSTINSSSSFSRSSSSSNDSLSSCSSSSQASFGSTRRRRWAVGLFATCTVLLFADQNLMSPNLTAIAREFDFDDTERDRKLGGDIALAFWVLGAPASIVVGCLGDTFNRSRLFALTVGIGEGACLATYFARTYAQLYVCRAVTGFSIGGAIPLIYSVVADLFPADQRHGVSAMVSIGSGCGISIGQGVAGYLGPTFGWRLPFLVISLPALLCAMLVYLTVPDPERGGMERAVRHHRRQNHRGSDKKTDNGDVHSHENPVSFVEMVPLGTDHHGKAAGATNFETVTVLAEATEAVPGTSTGNGNKCDMRANWTTFKLIVSTPSSLLLMFQGAPGCLPWGIVNTYLNDFLSENRGMSVEVSSFFIV